MDDLDPGVFWREIGRLAGWRLYAYNGFEGAHFTLLSGDVIVVNAAMAHVLRQFSVTLSAIAEDFRTLIEAISVVPHVQGHQRKKAVAESVELSRLYERRLGALQTEHRYLFSDLEEDAPEDD